MQPENPLSLTNLYIYLCKIFFKKQVYFHFYLTVYLICCGTFITQWCSGYCCRLTARWLWLRSPNLQPPCVEFAFFFFLSSCMPSLCVLMLPEFKDMHVRWIALNCPSEWVQEKWGLVHGVPCHHAETAATLRTRDE